MVESAACPSCGRALPEAAAACAHCAPLPKAHSLFPTQVGGPQEHAPGGVAPALPEIEGYRIVRMLGQGGMGVVFLAEDTTLNRRVAIKVMTARLAADAAARAFFLREARSMATVEHPHVVRIYSFGERSGVAYLVMEYVEGESLAERIRRHGKLPIEDAMLIAGQVTEGLETAWEKGIVHRDVKPANVLIDARGRAHVGDFGLAKPVVASDDMSLTQDGLIVGTPDYLSPEQARGEKVDCRSDIYSLGVVLYEMLGGVPPFGGATPVAIVAHHLHTAPPPLRDRRPDVPANVARLVEQMMEKDRERRPQSYAELRRAIDEWSGPTAVWTSGSPFRGLSAFEFEHAAIFFGRAQAVEEAVNALREQAVAGRAFVLVLGMSGSGKSSLVRAGVVPRLVQPGAIEGVSLWRRAVLRPAEAAGDVFEGLAAALARSEALPELLADGTTASELGRLLRENPKGAALLVRGGLSQVAAEKKRAEGRKDQPDVRLIVVVDQMEELFTLERSSAEERRGFIDALSSLARSGRVWVVATLRSDFYGRCEELPELMALKQGAGQYHLQPPSPAEVAQMIRLPARAASLRFEQDKITQAGLDEVLRDAALEQVGHLPLLEFALEELYRLRTPDGLLTHSAYATMGGVEGALIKRAEEVFASLSPAQQAVLPEVFGALVRISAGNEETFNRRYAALDAFGIPESGVLVDAFVASRLFVADRGNDGGAVVSIAHEALLRSWPRLREWLDDNRELLRVRGRLSASAGLWVEKGRLRDLLLAEGKPLEEALPLLRMRGLDLSADERRFLEASKDRSHRLIRTRHFMNLNSIALIIGAALLTGLYLWKVVPTLYLMAEGLGLELPLPTRLTIMASNYLVRLMPLLVVATALLYRFRKRVPAPEFISLGTALTVAGGWGLFGIQLGLVALLLQVAIYLPALRRSGVYPDSAAVAMQERDYARAGTTLRLKYEWLLKRGWSIQYPHSALLLADAQVALGDDDLARQSFSEASIPPVGGDRPGTEADSLMVQSTARAGLSSLAAELPRLGVRLLDARTDGFPMAALVAAVNRGGPAFRSGLRKGDLIRSIDGVDVPDRSGLVAELRRRSVGQRVNLEASRGDRLLKLVVQLGKAENMFTKGCESGFMEDCASLGMVYDRGEGVLVDVARAVGLYRRACEAGEPSGCVSLGLMHERGGGVAIDVVRAAVFYEQSCAAGDVWGCNNLGALRAKGTDAATSGTGADLFARACDAGLPEACANRRLLAATGARDTRAPTFADSLMVAILGTSVRGGQEQPVGPPLVTPARPYTR